jgi:hypothetical protein
MPPHQLAVALAAPLAIVLLGSCDSNSNDDPSLPSPTPSDALQPAATSDLCSTAIPALTSAGVTKERLDAAVGKMAEVRQSAHSGDAAAARAAFAGETHDITHDIDQPLRKVDTQLARDLCESVLSLEQQFAGTPDLQVVSLEARMSATLLEEAGGALGLIEEP